MPTDSSLDVRQVIPRERHPLVFRTFETLKPDEDFILIADHDPSNPFNAVRASLPETSFIILQAPAHLSIGEASQSWGQTPTKSSRMAGLTFVLPEQVAVPKSREAFGDDGKPKDAAQQASVENLGARLTQVLQKLT